MPALRAPESGVTVRMYRIGHGDCFLLAFRGDDGEPVYALIDCGRMPGSSFGKKLGVHDVVSDIRAATGGHLHLVIATHEHLDHVGGFGTTRKKKHIFDAIETIDTLWTAWTEDGDDPLANDLRSEHGDVLGRLTVAAQRVASARGTRAMRARDRMLDLLELEVPADHRGRSSASGRLRHLAAVKGRTNKEAIGYLEQRAGRVERLRPHGRPYALEGVTGLRVYCLGPPRNRALLYSEEPEHDEAYTRRGFVKHLDFLLDAGAAAARRRANPFQARFRLSPAQAAKEPLFRERYGTGRARFGDAWRQIEDDWLGAAEALSLRLNRGINNTSLVLAFELPRTNKVLLFTADAQRGNWVSWTTDEFVVDGRRRTAKDLLAHTVFYKVGHHGSHNATLKGRWSDEHPNLGWLGRGDYRDELVAMIPAHAHWARTKSHPWNHPLPSIERALKRRASGRVIRADDATTRAWHQRTVLDTW